MSGSSERGRAGKWERRWSEKAGVDRDPSEALPPGGRSFRVRIVYTEPEFQERNPECPREFSFSQECPAAGSLHEAVRQAVGYFDFCAENSSVGWRRIIKSVTVKPA
jgi:hypothetical protein